MTLANHAFQVSNRSHVILAKNGPSVLLADMRIPEAIDDGVPVVFLPRNPFKVLDAVVPLDPVFVVDLVARRRLRTNECLKNKPMHDACSMRSIGGRQEDSAVSFLVG